MLCERGCLPAAWLARRVAWRLRSSLTYPLDLSLSPSISLPSSRSFSLGSLASLSTPFHPSSFLGLPAFTFCSPRHAGLVITFPPTEPPTPRLRDDVNSHAHVFKLPHHVRVIWSGSCTRFLTSKANASCSSGEPMILCAHYDLFLILKAWRLFFQI